MGLRPEPESFLYTFCILVVTCNTAAACGIIIGLYGFLLFLIVIHGTIYYFLIGTFFSAACESISLAISFLIPFDYILFITGGVLISLSSMPNYISWTKYMSWFLYTNEALSIVQWQNVSTIQCDQSSLDCLASGREVLCHYGFDPSHFSIDFTSMLVIYAGFHLMGLAAIVKRSRS